MQNQTLAILESSVFPCVFRQNPLLTRVVIQEPVSLAAHSGPCGGGGWGPSRIYVALLSGYESEAERCPCAGVLENVLVLLEAAGPEMQASLFRKT